MISAVDQLMQVIHTELVQGIISPEQIRGFIHPRLDGVVVVLYRSPDDVAEADAIHAERQQQC